MKTYLTKAGLGIALAATTLTVAAPADAQRYRRYNRGGDVATGAIVGGIVGLGIGAAIASSNRDRFYDRGYYDRGYYGGPRGFRDGRRGWRGDGYWRDGRGWRGDGYGRGYYGRGYYDRGYYDRGYAPGYYGW